MRVKLTYFALWRLFFVNLRQFIHILMVELYSIILLEFLAWSCWLIFLLLRKLNWLMCFRFRFWLLMLLFLFFLIKMVEVLRWFPAYCVLLYLVVLINKSLVRWSLLRSWNNCLIKLEDVITVLWLLLDILLRFVLNFKAETGQISKIV